jgi:hypothetical protein
MDSHSIEASQPIDKEMNMHVMKRFTLTLTSLTGLCFSPLIAQTPSLQTVPLSADIDVVSVRTLPDGNTLRQERKKMKFYRRADGSARLEEANRLVIVDNGAQTVTVLDPISKTAQVQATPTASTNGRKPVATRPQLQVAGSSLGGSDNSEDRSRS